MENLKIDFDYEKIFEWVDSHNITRQKRNVHRDFSDAGKEFCYCFLTLEGKFLAVISTGTIVSNLTFREVYEDKNKDKKIEINSCGMPVNNMSLEFSFLIVKGHFFQYRWPKY